MKIIQSSQLSEVNPISECFIVKNVIDESECDKIINYLNDKLNSLEENQKFEGDNWYYDVKKSDTYFHSFLFNQLSSVNCPAIVGAYKKLFEYYKFLGQDIEGDFEYHMGNDFSEDIKTINPLVFWYPAGVGRFDWHQHPPQYQKFQLLLNLTQPNLDYVGGHTHVKLNEAQVEIFDENFEKGDVFSFPYTLWHKVEPVIQSISALKARVSLLMPVHPRVGIATKYK